METRIVQKVASKTPPIKPQSLNSFPHAEVGNLYEIFQLSGILGNMDEKSQNEFIKSIISELTSDKSKASFRKDVSKLYKSEISLSDSELSQLLLSGRYGEYLLTDSLRFRLYLQYSDMFADKYVADWLHNKQCSPAAILKSSNYLVDRKLPPDGALGKQIQACKSTDSPITQ